MSFNEKTDQMDWKDESGWMLISIVSGLLLSYLYIYYQRFPDADNLTIVVICYVAFYVFSIILRIQNHRGKAITGKPGFNEKALKYFFPVPGFVIGIALLLL
jgi:hypothetical protein